MWRKSGVGFLTFAAVSFLGTAAWAGGSLKDAPVDEGYVWSGLYVGVGIGASQVDSSVDVNGSKTVRKEKCKKSYQNPIEYCDKDSAGWADDPYFEPFTKFSSAVFGDDDWKGFGTIQLGYDKLINERILVGIFGDYDFYPDADNDFSGPLQKKGCEGPYCKAGFVKGSFELDHAWSIGARLGFLVTPRVLLYGVGGYTEASFDGQTDVFFKGTKLTIAAPDELQGWFVGGGGEFKLHKNLSLKLEYRFSHYDAEGGSDADTDPGMKFCWRKHCSRFVKDFTADADFDTDIHSVRAVLVMKLGDHERHVEPLK